MIIVASQRGGAKALGLHLLNSQDNEHVTVHEVRGFAADNVVEAFKEAQAIAKGTRCQQFLFSCSFNPPAKEQVGIEAFEDAIQRVEERNGLSGQPRVIVFHEKEGRRHAHCVWSRIDTDTMTARNMAHYKAKITVISCELYREHGWQMPRGLEDKRERDPRCFDLATWQQAKRAGYHARDLKGIIQHCWKASDSGPTFTSALDEHGLKLARGDRRAHVIITHDGEIFAAARYAGVKTKEMKERLGDPQDLRSIDEAKAEFARELTDRGKRHLAEADMRAARTLKPLDEKRRKMTAAHRRERADLERQQAQRWQEEATSRDARHSKGWRGLWKRVTGAKAKIDQQNQKETIEAQQRDRQQRQDLINAQLRDRQWLQAQIQTHRARAVRERTEIHRELYRIRERKLEPEQPPNHRNALLSRSSSSLSHKEPAHNF